MTIKTKGIVIAQRNIGEQDKIITILSKDIGMVEASVKGYKSIRNNKMNAVALFSYLDFVLFKGRTAYFVNSAETIESFYDIRFDVEKLALAGYFCELTHSLSITEENAWVCLRLLLNTLHLLSISKRENVLLKTVYELKILSVNGFMPNLVGCRICNQYERERMYLYPLEGTLICSDCLQEYTEKESVKRIPLHKTILAALRHIIYCEDEKLFNFSLSPKALAHLGKITEYYMFIHMDRSFKALDMYKQLAGGIH